MRIIIAFSFHRFCLSWSGLLLNFPTISHDISQREKNTESSLIVSKKRRLRGKKKSIMFSNQIIVLFALDVDFWLESLDVIKDTHHGKLQYGDQFCLFIISVAQSKSGINMFIKINIISNNFTVNLLSLELMEGIESGQANQKIYIFLNSTAFFSTQLRMHT